MLERQIYSTAALTVLASPALRSLITTRLHSGFPSQFSLVNFAIILDSSRGNVRTLPAPVARPIAHGEPLSA